MLPYSSTEAYSIISNVRHDKNCCVCAGQFASWLRQLCTVWYICSKHCETTARTERTWSSHHVKEASWSYSSGARKPPLATDKLPYRLQGGFTCLQSTVNRQPGLSPSVGQGLHAYHTASVVKAAFLTEATSENWNCKTCVQPSCSDCLERSAARLMFCGDIRTIQICDQETFLRTGFCILITWLFPLPRFIFF